MKKILLSMITVAALSSSAMGTSAFNMDDVYTGIGYTYGDVSLDHFVDTGIPATGSADVKGNAGLFILGYDYNEHLTFETRYTTQSINATINDGTDIYQIKDQITNIGFYLKPKYSMDNITLYGLAGYGWMTIDATLSSNSLFDFDDKDTEGTFQWGAGVSYALSDHAKIFFDYVHFNEVTFKYNSLDINFDADVDTYNIGFAYKF
jgi:opacity protein-like surface antigen